MSCEGTSTILGGLPVWVVISCGRDYFSGEFWSEVDSIHWLTRKGTKGKEIPDHLYDRAEKYDQSFCMLMESIFEQLAYEKYEAERLVKEAERMDRFSEVAKGIRKRPARKLELTPLDS